MKYAFAQIALGLSANVLVAQGYAISSQSSETPCETVVTSSKYVATVVVPTKPVETPCEETTTFVTSKYVVTSVATTKTPVISSSYVVPTTVVVPSSKPSETPCETIVVPSSKPASSQPASSYVQPSTPASTQSAPKPTYTTLFACPADLKGTYEFPHLIVPVNSKQPNKAYGTSYFGTVDSTTCTIFNFDIPASYAGKTCTLAFLFPLQSQLETSSFTYSGQGKIQFSRLSGPATEGTTYANQPAKADPLGDLGSLAVAPGNSYSIASTSCAAGQRIAYKLCGTGDLSLNYFQDYNPSPIGLYIRQC